jgi:hypothetical protein
MAKGCMRARYLFWRARPDSNGRPADSKSFQGCQTNQFRTTSYRKAMPLPATSFAGLGWFWSMYPHKSCTIENARLPAGV